MNDSNLELDHAFESALVILEVRETLKIRSGGADELDRLKVRTGELCHQTPDKYLPSTWRVMNAGLSVLASHVKSVAIAHGADGDLVSEQARKQVLIGEFRTELNREVMPIPPALEEVRRELAGNIDPSAERIRDFLLQVPLPAIYFKKSVKRFPVREHSHPQDDAPAPLVCAIAFLDHAPLVTPQLVKVDLLYPLAFRLKGLTWPDEATRLRVDLLTTCPGSEFSVSQFVLDRPETIKGFEYEGEVSGQIKFNSAQSSLLEDLVFVVRAAFELPNGVLQEIPVIGHHELRLRVTNQQNHPLMSGNRRLDRHVEELLTKLLKECPSVRGELDDLLPMLHALTLLLATYAQEAIYKGRSKVSEAEFQTVVIRDLRNRLGQDVQEHPGQAGGITDIRFRGVIVELKVEDQNSDRQHICQKYTAQPAQYAGVEARQVSVLLVLDVTTKDKPPGDIRNDILLTNVETHGGTADAKPFPSKAFVFVVNGNMKSPSEYSK